MNDRQREIVDATVDRLIANSRELDREEVSTMLYQLVIDYVRPPRLTVPETLRRSPMAGEVLPRYQRATWARENTVHDAE